MKRYDELKALVEELEFDFEKFYSRGNKAAGTRLRKGLMEIRNLSQEIRKEIQEMKNT